MPDHSFCEDIFPNMQSEPPLMQVEAIASRPFAGYLGEETNTHLTTPSCQGAVESHKVPPRPPLLQTEQPQLPQLLLVRLVLAATQIMKECYNDTVVKFFVWFFTPFLICLFNYH